MNTFIEEKLIQRFAKEKSFSRQELYDFFREYEPDLKDGTFGWRIYDLKKRNVIRMIKRGWYSCDTKQNYIPELNKHCKKIQRVLHQKYDLIDYCIWDTTILNSFSLHQSSQQNIILEVEKDLVESTYFHLKDNTRFEVFLEPSNIVMERYVSDADMPIIVKRLISRSPLMNKHQMPTPTLEKIIVDLIADYDLFFYYQGGELHYMFNHIFQNYTIDVGRLKTYANRRSVYDELKSLLNHDQKALF